MNVILTTVAEAIAAFFATNIDDIIILLLFFSQVDVNFRPRHIVSGQYIGFGLIIIASLPGFFGGLLVAREWIGLLGILPIVIGIKQLINREDESTEVQTVTSDFQPDSTSNPIWYFLLSFVSPQSYKVAAVTFANGGDNISIYIPLFAGNSLINLGVILGVFFLMVGVLCGVAFILARHSAMAYILSRYGKKLVPLVLIGLGLLIMYARGTFSLIPLWQN